MHLKRMVMLYDKKTNLVKMWLPGAAVCQHRVHAPGLQFHKCEVPELLSTYLLVQGTSCCDHICATVTVPPEYPVMHTQLTCHIIWQAKFPVSVWEQQ